MYWLNLLILPLEYYFIKHLNLNKYHRNILFLFFVFLQWWLIASLRDQSVGWDTPTYISYFSKISSYDFQSSLIVFRLEPLYLALNLFITQITVDYHIFLSIIAAIIYILILTNIPKYSCNPWLTCFLFVAFGFYNFSINILRQSIALALVIFSFKYIVNRKFLQFILILSIATLFHYTAIVFVITYFFYKIKITPKSFFIILSAIICISFLLLPKIMGIIILFNPYYDQYMGEAETKGIGMFLMLFASSCASLILLRGKDLDEFSQLWLVMICIATAMQIFAFQISILVRVVYYWQIAMIFLFPAIINQCQLLQNKQIVLIFIIVVSLIYYANYAINPMDINGTVPYSTFL